MDVLFLFAHWHGLAKLRLHTDTTLDTMDQLTRIFGSKLREFAKKTCSAYKTRELKKEVDARNRRHTKRSTKAKVKFGGPHSATSGNAQTEMALLTLPAGVGDAQDQQEEQTSRSTGAASDTRTCPGPSRQTGCTVKPNTEANSTVNGRKMKQLNLNTYKYHAMGDVVHTIRRYGTTDSYSTEPVCSCYCAASEN
jgi:hypothetical protein